MCITTNRLDTKSNPYPDPNPSPTTKQHAVASVQLNIVTCPTCPGKILRDEATFLLFSVSCTADGGVRDQLGPQLSLEIAPRLLFRAVWQRRSLRSNVARFFMSTNCPKRFSARANRRRSNQIGN